MKRIASLIATAGLLLGGVVVASPASAITGTIETQLLAAHNALRKSKCGANSLTISSGARTAAQIKAQDMRDNNYFSHDRPNGEKWYVLLDRYTDFNGEAQNLQGGAINVSAVMTAWKNSPGHLANIMNCSYDKVGFGYIARGTTNSYFQSYWVANFGHTA